MENFTLENIRFRKRFLLQKYAIMLLLPHKHSINSLAWYRLNFNIDIRKIIIKFVNTSTTVRKSENIGHVTSL